MAFHVRDPETDTLVREVARRRGVGLTETVRQLASEALQRDDAEPSMLDKIHALQAEIAKRPNSGPKPDKAFFDWLSGEEDD